MCMTLCDLSDRGAVLRGAIVFLSRIGACGVRRDARERVQGHGTTPSGISVNTLQAAPDAPRDRAVQNGLLLIVSKVQQLHHLGPACTRDAFTSRDRGPVHVAGIDLRLPRDRSPQGVNRFGGHGPAWTPWHWLAPRARWPAAPGLTPRQTSQREPRLAVARFGRILPGAQTGEPKTAFLKTASPQRVYGK